MAKYPSENTDALKYFRAYLEFWLERTGFNKTFAAKRLGIGQSQLNEIINGKRGASINLIERVCSNLRSNIVDVLEQGRKLCGESPKEDNFSKNQIEAIEDFKIVVSNNDSAAKMIVNNVLDYAENKRNEAGLANNFPENIKSA